jgi:ketosteroid isomerase-like protein
MTSRPQLFDDLDRMDPDSWERHLASDIVMRFGNEDPVHGRAACRAQVEALFTSVRSIAHHVVDHWEHGETTIVEALVDFVLPDGTELALPMVTIYRTERGGLIDDYRVYLDPSPLWP